MICSIGVTDAGNLAQCICVTASKSGTFFHRPWLRRHSNFLFVSKYGTPRGMPPFTVEVHAGEHATELSASQCFAIKPLSTGKQSSSKVTMRSTFFCHAL